MGDPIGALIEHLEPSAIRDLKHQLTEARAEIERLREVLGWYGEQARLCRLVHSEGDAGRHMLARDGGARAREALEKGDD